MVTDINMNDFPTDTTFTGSFSKTIKIFIPSLGGLLPLKARFIQESGGT